MKDNYNIELYHRPNSQIVDEIVDLAKRLTSEWFTSNIPKDTRCDLLFQDAIGLRCNNQLVSFLIFTGWDGSLHITLMGTHPDYRGQGWGSILLQHFFQYAKQLGFDRIIALTVPPDVKPSYYSTLKFYQKHGFVITKRYNDLWEKGALELVKILE